MKHPCFFKGVGLTKTQVREIKVIPMKCFRPFQLLWGMHRQKDICTGPYTAGRKKRGWGCYCCKNVLLFACIVLGWLQKAECSVVVTRLRFQVYLVVAEGFILTCCGAQGAQVSEELLPCKCWDQRSPSLLYSKLHLQRSPVFIFFLHILIKTWI